MSPEEETALDNLSIQIFTSANVMSGVGLAVIGILSTDPSLKKLENIGDFLLSVNVLLFLCASLLSYCYLRGKKKIRYFSSIRLAELCFIGGMVLTLSLAIMLTYEFM